MREVDWKLAAVVASAALVGWVASGVVNRRATGEGAGDDATANPTAMLPDPTVASLVGNTPLVHLKALSAKTNRTILAKAEFLNPGGSIKDRVALQIIQDALASGALRPGGLITEGTVGSTRVSLALLAPSYGCRAFIAMPDDAAEEKSRILVALGAEVARVRPVGISHPDHFVHVARRRAAAACANKIDDDEGEDDDDDDDGEDRPAAPAPSSSVFADQFENLANMKAHLRTGREILRQVKARVYLGEEGPWRGRVAFPSLSLSLCLSLLALTRSFLLQALGLRRIDAFVCGCGTGGTMAGVGRVLKGHDDGVRLVVADPPGSGLLNKVKRGVMYTREEAEGKRLKNPIDTIAEGVGINRLTGNFAQIVGEVDDEPWSLDSLILWRTAKGSERQR